MLVLKRIQEIRKAKNISQKQMAEALNISQPGYQKIEQGINVLSIERFLEICRILEIDSYNSLLPMVSATNVNKIEMVLMAGYLSFDNIRNNAKHISKLISELVVKIKADQIDSTKIIEEIEFLENYLAIISRESTTNKFDFLSIQKLVDKID
jgi:transcriptional regulator with XRE-family HTH domain